MARDRQLQDLKHLLQRQIEALCRDLLPDGSRAGRYWIARNPSREDRHAGSFYVWLSGAPGAWEDKATGQKGDVLSLIILCRRLGAVSGDPMAFRGAIEWGRAWLGMERMTGAEIENARAEAKRQAESLARSEAGRLEAKRRSAMAWWLSAEKGVLGTPVEAYLASRGIALSSLPRLPRALRYAPRLEHKKTGTVWPAIMSAMTDAEGRICAVHRTYLAMDGSSKAPVEPQRMMWGDVRGSAIRLWRGETGLGPEEAARHGLLDTLALVEGIEDGLSLALACPDLRIWAAGSLGNLAAIRLPRCSDEVIVCADNDWGKPQAQRALEEALAVLGRQAGVRVARAGIGKDFNDQLRGQAA